MNVYSFTPHLRINDVEYVTLQTLKVQMKSCISIFFPFSLFASQLYVPVSIYLPAAIVVLLFIWLFFLPANCECRKRDRFLAQLTRPIFILFYNKKNGLFYSVQILFFNIKFCRSRFEFFKL